MAAGAAGTMTLDDGQDMPAAFVRLEESGIHAAETHGLFALGQNMAAEWKRQRAALLEWAYRLTLDAHLPAPRWLAPLGPSPFGLWLQHKAPHLFDDAPELALIGGALRHIDEELLAELQEAAPGTSAMRAALAGLDLALEGVRSHLSDLFERYLMLEGGRDALTQLLHRRFLSAVVHRQIQLHKARKSRGFALMVLDIDHFESVHDRLGPDVGDQVLQQAARLLSRRVRAGDFVFRYGEAEMLVVLTEIDGDEALKVAEALRNRFEHTPLAEDGEEPLFLTVSIGVAGCGERSGVLNHRQLIKAADAALCEAQQAGRNRCRLAAVDG